MALVSDAKTKAAPFNNASEIVRVAYDFAVDAGATGALTLLTADGPILVRMKSLFVETAVLSAGALTLDIGTNTTADVIAADIAKAALTILSVHQGDTAESDVVYLADAGIIKQTIVAAAATAGKLHYTFEVWKPQA